MRHKTNKCKEVKPNVFRRINRESINYAELIASLDIEPEEKERLLNDLGLGERRSGYVLMGYLTLIFFFILLSIFAFVELIKTL